MTMAATPLSPLGSGGMLGVGLGGVRPRSPKMAAPATLRPGEEDWQESVDRLSERFPAATPRKVIEILRANQGHAGRAASDLRDATSEVVKEMDPDDSEHVATLLSNPALFKQTCKSHFKKYDVNRNGTLEWEEILGLTDELCQVMGLPAPSEGRLTTFFEGSDSNGDGVLSEREFTKFYEAFLRYAFFHEHRRLMGVWRFKVDGGHSAELSITQSKDWRIQLKSKGGCPGAPKLQSAEGRVEVSGNLELVSGWLVAEVKFTVRDAEKRAVSKAPFGFLRLQFADSTDVVIANFKNNPDADWGRDCVLRRQKTLEEERVKRAGTPKIGISLRCICPQGINFRRSPEFCDKTDNILASGQIVRVLEGHMDTHWVRVRDGWLPTVDSEGRKLFETVTESLEE